MVHGRPGLGHRGGVPNQGVGRCCRRPRAAADVYIVSVVGVFFVLVFVVVLVFAVCAVVCVAIDTALLVYIFLPVLLLVYLTVLFTGL